MLAYTCVCVHVETRKERNSTRNGERAHAVAPTYPPPCYEYAFSTVKYVQIASRYSRRPFIIVASSYSPREYSDGGFVHKHGPKLLIRVNCNHRCITFARACSCEWKIFEPEGGGEEIGVGIVDTGWISFKGGYFDGI